jgi:8-oxo-dGTP pyrophosphatase MutT (NUDIX family)
VKLGKSQREKEPVRVASIAAFNPDGLLLFGLRNDVSRWTLPGGHFEPNEEPIEAARRELEEETGLKGENFEYLGVGEVKEGLHIYCFRCMVVGEPDGCDDPDEECSEWRWVEPHDVPDEIMENLHSKKNVTLRLLGIQEGEVDEPLEKKDLLMTKPFPVQHYSTTPGLKTLDPAFQGTGAAGQEKNRNKRIPRTYYYTRPGIPEAHVASGAHLYHAELPVGTRLYDMGNDELNLKAGKWKQTKYGMMYEASDFDAVEKKLKRMGYHGYHSYGVKDALVYFHKLPARHIVGQGLQKGGFLATAALAGSMAMGGAQHVPVVPHVPEQHQSAAQAPAPAWTPESLHPDMIPIAHLESSFGQNMAHASHPKGEFHTAFGALGFKPSTAHEEYTKSKLMNQNYPGLAAPEDFMAKFKGDPKFYNLLASAHFARLKQRHGDPQKAAYAWRWGSTACANATDEQIQNDVYVQKYTAMKLHGKQLAKGESLNRAMIPISNVFLLNRWGHPINPDRVNYHLQPGANTPPIKVQLGPDDIGEYSHVNDPQLEQDGEVQPFDHSRLLDPSHPKYFVSDGHHRVRAAQERGDTHIEAEVHIPETPHWLKGDKKAQYEAQVGAEAAKLGKTDSIERVKKFEDLDKGINGDWSKDPSYRFKIDSDAKQIQNKESLVKMALVHNDPVVPKTVYRIQNDRGEGPYDGLGGEFMDTHFPKANDVSPEEDFNDEELETLHQTTPSPRFAFSHPDHAKKWFGEKGLQKLAGLGYKLVPVQAHKVWQSKTGSQVMYMKKSENDPLEALLQHPDPRERILALKNKNVTPYHLRLALQDEDQSVRAFAARHPKMTEPLIHEALQHEDLETRKAALSRPDLTPEHIQSVLFDPDLQTMAALHPRTTEEQRSMVSDHHQTPSGLKTELLHKSIGYLMYPRLGQNKVPTQPMIRTPEAHQEMAVVGAKALGIKPGLEMAMGHGYARYNMKPTVPLDPSRRMLSLSVRSGPGHALIGKLGHETQHGIFAHLKQVYGKQAGQRIVDSTLSALDPDDHAHIKKLTDWAIRGYNVSSHPEERIAHLQNYLQDATWRAKAHKSMRILGHRNAEKISHDMAKRIWQKLKLRAENLTPQEVGVILKTEDERLSEWVAMRKNEVQVQQIIKSDKDLDYNGYEDQLGVQSKFEAILNAAKFLAHIEPDYGLFRQALLSGLTLDSAALTAVCLPADDKNKKALLAVLSLQDKKFNKSEDKAHEVQAMMPDGVEVADAVRRGFGAETHKELHLDGKHSSGAMMVRDPETGMMYLLKPGSGKQSPALGAREEGANQSRREAAFWHVAERLGLGARVPRADLLMIDGKEVAVLHLLPFNWKNLEKLKFEDAGLPHKALEKYRHTGELHKWSVLDYILGNPDRHGQNLMVGPEKDGHPVALIDHGSAFAGPSFDPARDKNSFIPYYLRAWKGDAWYDLPPEKRLRSMPALNQDSDDQLRNWLHGIHAGDVEAVLVRYGIDPQPSLDRLARVKRLLEAPILSEALNQLWLAT